MARRPHQAARGMVARAAARPRSAPIRIGRRRERSTKPPPKRPTRIAGPRDRAARTPTWAGEAPRLTTAAKGRPSRVIRAPKAETAWAAHSLRKSAWRHRPRGALSRGAFRIKVSGKDVGPVEGGDVQAGVRERRLRAAARASRREDAPAREPEALSRSAAGASGPWRAVSPGRPATQRLSRSPLPLDPRRLRPSGFGRTIHWAPAFRQGDSVEVEFHELRWNAQGPELGELRGGQRGERLEAVQGFPRRIHLAKLPARRGEHEERAGIAFRLPGELPEVGHGLREALGEKMRARHAQQLGDPARTDRIEAHGPLEMLKGDLGIQPENPARRPGLR